jgi:hypothetical protein
LELGRGKGVGVDIRLLESFAIFETKEEHSLQRDKSGYLDRINGIWRHMEPEIGLMVTEMGTALTPSSSRAEHHRCHVTETNEQTLTIEFRNSISASLGALSTRFWRRF